MLAQKTHSCDLVKIPAASNRREGRRRRKRGAHHKLVLTPVKGEETKKVPVDRRSTLKIQKPPGESGAR